MEPFGLLNAFYWEACLSTGVLKDFVLIFTTSLWSGWAALGKETEIPEGKVTYPDLKANWWNRDCNLNRSHGLSQDLLQPSKRRCLSLWGQANKSFKWSWITASADMKFVDLPPKSLRSTNLWWAVPCRVPVDLWTDSCKAKQSHSAPRKKMCENAVM